VLSDAITASATAIATHYTLFSNDQFFSTDATGIKHYVFQDVPCWIVTFEGVTVPWNGPRVNTRAKSARANGHNSEMNVAVNALTGQSLYTYSYRWPSNEINTRGSALDDRSVRCLFYTFGFGRRCRAYSSRVKAPSTSVTLAFAAMLYTSNQKASLNVSAAASRLPSSSASSASVEASPRSCTLPCRRLSTALATRDVLALIDHRGRG